MGRALQPLPQPAPCGQPHCHSRWHLRSAIFSCHQDLAPPVSQQTALSWAVCYGLSLCPPPDHPRCYLRQRLDNKPQLVCQQSAGGGGGPGSAAPPSARPLQLRRYSQRCLRSEPRRHLSATTHTVTAGRASHPAALSPHRRPAAPCPRPSQRGACATRLGCTRRPVPTAPTKAWSQKHPRVKAAQKGVMLCNPRAAKERQWAR